MTPIWEVEGATKSERLPNQILVKRAKSMLVFSPEAKVKHECYPIALGIRKCRYLVMLYASNGTIQQ